MAIKIDNKDLSKRIINWQEVQKVILNWAEIRPNEVPHVDYHVINDFTWWGSGWWSSLPTWWGTNSSNVNISSWWISSSTWASATVNYNTMPSLANASRVNIVVEFDWTPLHDVNNTQFLVGFPNQSANVAISTWVQYFNNHWVLWNYGGGRTLENPTQWEYKLDFDVWMNPYGSGANDYKCTATLLKEWVEQLTFTNDMTNVYEYLMRTADRLFLTLWQWVVIKKIDVYIYNDLSVPSTRDYTGDFTNWKPTWWVNSWVTWWNDWVYSTNWTSGRIEFEWIPTVAAKRIELTYSIHYTPTQSPDVAMNWVFFDVASSAKKVWWSILNRDDGILSSNIMVEDQYNNYYWDWTTWFQEWDYEFKVVLDLEHSWTTGSLWWGLYSGSTLINEVDNGKLSTQDVLYTRRSYSLYINLRAWVVLSGIYMKCYN